MIEVRSTGLRKVPQVTVLFWVVKLLTTALGESASDFMVNTVDPYLAVGASFLVFVIALGIQLRSRRYIPWVYWLAVTMVAVFGTMAADVIHVVLGIPYLVSTVAFAAALAVIFLVWRRVEGTLSIHSITGGRRELFYWAAVLATFALGTAAGDLLAYTAHLGFLDAGLVFAVLFAIPGLAYRFAGLNATLAFWTSYVVTRPLGASFADWSGKEPAAGGIGWGDGPVAAVLAVFIVVGVAAMHRQQKTAGQPLETASVSR
ncbi:MULTISPECIES: hypothetical protein [Arthrobacter]|uniref:Membrane-anchored protein n=2 Tax=Arthrobacter TaxID=1663 RepID=A0ABU9KLT1_9MICC|nr:hypothetical protein [Arthrobacter sp. YJM1]MDP5228212.1 hypothetical protein [Arthrobacter sp. YJM1]